MGNPEKREEHGVDHAFVIAAISPDALEKLGSSISVSIVGLHYGLGSRERSMGPRPVGVLVADSAVLGRRPVSSVRESERVGLE